MQPSLFDPAYQADAIPPFVGTVMGYGPDLAVSISGGKDSDAMLRFLTKLHRARGWQGSLYGLFCDLGRIEWGGVTNHLKRLCTELAIPLVKLYPKRSMVDEWEHRRLTILSKQENKPHWSSASVRFCTDRQKSQPSNKFLRGSGVTEKPFFSSAKSRFCTKHLKTQPSDKHLRQHNLVVCAIGIRAEESSGRAKKPRYQVRDDIAATWYKTPKTCKTAEEKEAWAEEAFQKWLDSGRKGRFALTWHPVLHWTLEQIWQYNGTSSEDVARRRALYQSGNLRQAIAGFPCHWAYISGNSRLSCAMCVMASTADIFNGAKLNPWTWAELALMEIIGGWGFQQGRWLASLSEEVLGLSFERRDRLYQVLNGLGLMQPCHPVFALKLLQSLPSGCIALWTQSAFLVVAHAIASYWITKDE